MDSIMFPKTCIRIAAAATLLLLSTGVARPGEVLVAVAANFAKAAEQLVESFEVQSGHDVIMSIGSTGKLYAQIVNGAPFDVFLSADRKHPELLERDERIVPGSRFTYAVGRLVAMTRPSLQDTEADASILSNTEVERIAIANPDLAPYGLAAIETIENAGLTESVEPKVILAETVGQVYAFVQTANVDVGFVAYSQVINRNNSEELGVVWLVPNEFHSPIQQDAVLTSRAENNPAAAEFHEFLQGERAREIVMSFGYDFPAADG